MTESVSSRQRFRQAMANDHARFVTIFVVTGVLTVLVPALSHAVTMAKYRRSYYYAYRQQEDANEGGRNFRDINDCRWYNPFCSSVYVNENGEYMDQGDGQNDFYTSVPSWFSGWGGSGVNSRDDDSKADSGAVKFVYAWQVIMFFLLLLNGALTLYKYRGYLAPSRVALSSLSLLLFVWANVSFLMMWLLANGSIYTGGRELEEIGGFYHQFSVMVFITNFWYVIWALFASIAVWRRVENEPADLDEDDNTGDMAYLPYAEKQTP